MVDKINSNVNMVNGFPEAQGPKKGQKKKEVNSNDIAKLLAQVNSQKKPEYRTGYKQALPQTQKPKKKKGAVEAGMQFGNYKGAISQMQAQAEKIGGKVVKEGRFIVLKDKNGKAVASAFQYDDGTYRYNDMEGRSFMGKAGNKGGYFDDIYTPDHIYHVVDKNGDHIIQQGEIDINT